MSEPNVNCLAGMRCPQCGHTDDFRITITTVAVVSDEGVESMGDKEWDDDSPCSCTKCNHMGIVLNFYEEEGDDA